MTYRVYKDPCEGDPASYHYILETVAYQSVLPKWAWPYEQNGYNLMPIPPRDMHVECIRAFYALVGCLDAPLGYDEDWS